MIFSTSGLSVDLHQMAVNNNKVFGEIIENLEDVSHLIARYAILEELYLHRKSTARDQLESMIIRLYAELLLFLVKAGDFFRGSAQGSFALCLAFRLG